MKTLHLYSNSASGYETRRRSRRERKLEEDEDEEMEDGYEIGEHGFEYHFESWYQDLCKELYGDEFEHWQEKSVRGREREVRDMTVTMASSYGDFLCGRDEEWRLEF
jgi:hypothetical protein